jgi:drug/metabolite transporter (DMT)-like permease|tara:strand:- start:4111 stop:5022 length:912 start_codon:yes stop_codon:yes gene_type:complete
MVLGRKDICFWGKKLIEGNQVRFGIILMILATLSFALQDGLSRFLAGNYNVYMIVMIRYWFLFILVVFVASRSQKGLLKTASTNFLLLQILRGILLAFEIIVSVHAFVYIGLINTSAIFSSYPLIATLLSIPILKEVIGWKRFTAILFGFLGVLLILRPGSGIFSLYMFLPVCSAFAFAIYAILTRYVSKMDSPETSFFWTGLVGIIAMTGVGVWFWEQPNAIDWLWILLLCIFSTLGHFLLIKSYDLAAVSIVQPFSYFHLIFISFIGFLMFGEPLTLNIILGSIIVICAGIFTLKRQKSYT